MKRKLLEQESSRKKPCRGLDFSEETIVKTEEEPSLETETTIQNISEKNLNVDTSVYQAVLNILTKTLILPLTVESLVKFHVLSTVKKGIRNIHRYIFTESSPSIFLKSVWKQIKYLVFSLHAPKKRYKKHPKVYCQTIQANFFF